MHPSLKLTVQNQLLQLVDSSPQLSDLMVLPHQVCVVIQQDYWQRLVVVLLLPKELVELVLEKEELLVVREVPLSLKAQPPRQLCQLLTEIKNYPPYPTQGF